MSANRFIESHGRGITKVNYSQLSGSAGTDSYGDPVYGTTATTVQAVYQRGRGGAIASDPSGIELTNTAEVYLKSTVSVDGPEASRPTTFVLDSQSFKTVSLDTQQDMIACHCEQEQS